MQRHGVTAYLVLCAAVILALCTHRAATASFTHDEAITFLNYPQLSVGKLLNHESAYTNNHLLNSLAMKGSMALFGTSELALRLPNLLALVLYLVYTALLIRRCHPLLIVVGFPLLFTNVYFMEMFTLARGYGLSYGFLAMAIYHASRAISRSGSGQLALMHLAGVLATLSNFALLTGYVAVLGAYAVCTMAGAYADRWSWERLRPVAQSNGLLLIASFIALSTPIRRVREANPLDFGGKSSFYSDTVTTLIDGMVPTLSLQGDRLMAAWVILTLVVAIALVVVLLGLRRSRASGFLNANAGLAIATLTLVLIGMGAYAQHLLFGVDHLKSRFALFLLVPLVLSFILLLGLWARKHPVAPILIACAACMWAVPPFAKRFGTHHSWEWGYDSQTKEALDALIADREHVWRREGFVQLGIDWLYEPSLNYYRTTRGLDWLCTLDREGLRPDDDYRYVSEYDTAAPIGFVEVAAFPHARTLLLRRASEAPYDSAGALVPAIEDLHAHEPVSEDQPE
ncbi:MAG TPA: hypothetical protein PKY96_00355 [Flavobacteriales bacterium]|nr:hypothetical protein [Flavobacteriales bacterium]HRD51075.1 hypothetical protein [Flavobacteriales bacterium]